MKEWERRKDGGHYGCVRGGRRGRRVGRVPTKVPTVP